MFESLETPMEIQEFAWSIAHDSLVFLFLFTCYNADRRRSYRTPLCVLYTPRLIAIACYVLAQRIYDGPNSPSLDARIAASSPSKSLPTPPSHNPPSPDASRALVDYYKLHEPEVEQVAGSFLHMLF